MGLAALKQDFSNILSPPPSVDLAIGPFLADDLHEFKRKIDATEGSLTRWQRKTRDDFKRGADEITDSIASVPTADLRDALFPIFDHLLAKVEEAMDGSATPLHEKPGASEKLRVFDQLPDGPRRFVRKQLRRIEDIRVSHYNFLVDLHYGLLAFKSEIDPDARDGESFVDPQALGDFLRSHIA